MESELQKVISKIVSQPLSQGYTHFDLLVEKIIEYYNQPVHTITEMKNVRKTKTKGDLWECFCKLYLKNVKKYDEVWLLSELPDHLYEELSLAQRDYGIDIIAKNGDKYTAIQCKFKKPRPGLVPGTWIPYNCVNWKELSTFYALCARTNNGKWQHQIVMTNTKYVRHMGKKTFKDRSYCRGSFAKLTHMDFVGLLNKSVVVTNNNVTNNNVTNQTKTIDELRIARLKYFQNSC